MKLTKEERHIILHSLGITRGGQSYRNHFVTGPGSVDYPHCEGLVAKKLMLKTKDPFNDMHESYCYYVTDEGKEAAQDSVEAVEKIA